MNHFLLRRLSLFLLDRREYLIVTGMCSFHNSDIDNFSWIEIIISSGAIDEHFYSFEIEVRYNICKPVTRQIVIGSVFLVHYSSELYQQNDTTLHSHFTQHVYNFSITSTMLHRACRATGNCNANFVQKTH